MCHGTEASSQPLTFSIFIVTAAAPQRFGAAGERVKAVTFTRSGFGTQAVLATDFPGAPAAAAGPVAASEGSTTSVTAAAVVRIVIPQMRWCDAIFGA